MLTLAAHVGTTCGMYGQNIMDVRIKGVVWETYKLAF